MPSSLDRIQQNGPPNQRFYFALPSRKKSEYLTEIGSAKSHFFCCSFFVCLESGFRRRQAQPVVSRCAFRFFGSYLGPMATFSHFLGVWRAAGDLGGTAGYAGVPRGGFGETGGGLGDFGEAWEARPRAPAARPPPTARPPPAARRPPPVRPPVRRPPHKPLYKKMLGGSNSR